MVEDFSKLSGIQVDALREIGNVGAGNAATALAQMINSRIDMSVPRVNILPFAEVPDLIGGADLHVAGIYLQVDGPAPASILFILPIEQASRLVQMLMGLPAGESKTSDFSEMEMSAMMELGNIISATYLNALSMFTQLDFIPSVPALGMDMAGALLDAVLAQFGEIADHVLVLETVFKKDNEDVVGNFFLMPEPGALNTILKALGVSI
ncbi:CheC-like protein [Syntrophomonas zehnderi OL-4]|uniref:CheC-like protein n=1 Tax=Syntrophomonas zehnderi OL-4 TaxID=690567 RepID=A0A0E4GBE1_9FIRM|nr:chemotaxis protein CheC [Syntrophomonas zehnderi]CFX66313.1 CheC-like protein [Syntrophomonas zehnderi OL-4]